MEPNSYLKLTVLAISLIFAGCASYAPSLVKLNPSGPNVRKATKGDLTIYVEEYATPEKSQRAFDAELADGGVLPLLILVENNGQQPYDVKVTDIVVRGASSLKALTPEEAATKAQRSAVGRAVGWSLIVPIIGIPVAVIASSMHTSKVNEQIVRDFAAKGFADGAIMPNKERSGFLFFQLEEGQKDLARLTLEMAARNAATGEVVIVSGPLPEATFTPKTQDASGSEESKRPPAE